MKRIVSAIVALLFVAGLVAWMFVGSVEIAAENPLPASGAQR